MTKYFVNCKTLDELKKIYKHLAQKPHPDVGGDTATMQTINAEYEARFEVLKRSQNTQAAEDATGKTRATTESAGDFIAIIDHLLKMDGLELELCGRWLWIGGNTKAHKEELKACGCRWSQSKKLWSWHFREDGDKWHRGSKSMAQIRSKYGSTTFTCAAAVSDAPASAQRNWPYCLALRRSQYSRHQFHWFLLRQTYRKDDKPSSLKT